MRKKLFLLQRQLTDSEGAAPHFRAGRDDTALKIYRAVLSAKIDILLWVLEEKRPPTFTIKLQAA